MDAWSQVRPGFVAMFEFQILKRVQVENPLYMWSWNGFYFPENEKKQRLGVNRTWSIRHIIFLFWLLNWNQLAVEVTQCRDPPPVSDIENEMITRLSLPFYPDPVYFGELLTSRAMTERHGEDSIYRWKKTNKWHSSMALTIGYLFFFVTGKRANPSNEIID